MAELAEFVSSKGSLYVGVFLATVSVAFITQTNNVLVIAVASGLTIIAIIIIMTYLVRHVKIIPKRNS
jgi:hypothetical protein